MDVSATSPDLDVVLDIYGQRLATIFTQIGLCFSMTDVDVPQNIVSKLEQGLARLSQAFPWVAGQVSREGATDGVTGVFKIRPLEATPRIFVRDLTNGSSSLSMDQLRRKGFPMRAFEEDIIAPRKSNSGRPGDVTAEVFQLQANFIKGGLILTFLGQHQAMDGIGLAQVLHLLSKACRAEPFTEEELETGNCAREEIIPLLSDSWKPGPELAHNIIKQDLSKPGPGNGASKMPAEKGTWYHFSFSPSAVTTLKSLATQTRPPTSKYVSTDDAISAFVWQSIVRARRPRFDRDTEALFARAVDLRRYLGISPSYPGFVQNMVYHKRTMQQLLDAPLGIIAADLRAAVDPATSSLSYDGRSFATLISRTPDKTTTSFLAGFDMSKDVMLSSWANQKSYELDFGLGLGRPEAVRRPRFDAFQGLTYLLPKLPTGEMGAAICLSDEDMERLQADEHFMKYASLVG